MLPEDPRNPSDSGESPATHSTNDLLQGVRAGDGEAREHLFKRYIPWMYSLVRGKLPRWARAMEGTMDLVQRAWVRVDGHLGTVRDRQHLQAFLANALRWSVRDAIRYVRRRPVTSPLVEDKPGPALSPEQAVIDRERRERYEAALARLTPEERRAVVMRIEKGCSYEEIGDSLGRSPDAARMFIVRALKRAAEEMCRD